MIVEVISVGTELLLGQIVNSNLAYIGARLAESGFDANHQVVVGDNLDRLAEAIGTAVDRSDAVILTGGIGPTPDDLTREAISAATGRSLNRDAAYERELIERWERLGRTLPENNLRQADVPEGGVRLPNPKGSAPGLEVDYDGTLIYALPGVPSEMYDLLDDHVMPRLRAATGDDAALVNRVIRTWGRGESAIAEAVDDLYNSSTNPSMAYLASDGEIKIRLTAKAATEAEAAALIAPIEAAVRERLGEIVFGADDDTIGSIILAELMARDWTVCTAESMTGGLVGGALTAQPGMSAVYVGGVVAYASDQKVTLLDVPHEVIDDHGAVSAETAIAMAEAARRRLGAEVGVAVTGSAGPEPQDQPVGTVFVAVATPEDTRVRQLRLPGDRERIRAYTTTSVLHLLRRAITGVWWR